VAVHTDDAVAVLDGSGEVLWLNGAFERLTGHTPDGVLGRQPERLLSGELTDRMQTMRLRAAILSGDAWRGELQHHRNDGTPFRHEISVSPVAGTPDAFRLWIGRDVSERRTLARRFLELSAVVELSMDGIVVLDDQMKIHIANGAYAQLVGRGSGAELQGTSWRDLQDAETLALFDRQVMPRLVLEAGWHGEFPTRRADGTTLSTEVTISLLSGGMALIVRDVTERTEYEEALRRMSLQDALTGLYNRRGFTLLAQQLLNVASRQHGHTLLLYFDLNHFKQVNDTWGHAVGDEALVEVAEVLRETFRESDLIARLGGDEFVVLAVNSLDPNGEVLLARLDQRLNLRNESVGRRYRLSLGRGMSRFDPVRPRSVDQLLHEADEQLMTTKRARTPNPERNPR
jgi:diguanylate cyclase (GGDEF)-like protein/PAS domain S-box-containing protein